MGCLTLVLGSSSLLSADAMRIPTQILICFLFPGLIGSMAISGNVHTFSLAPAAIINVIVNFGFVWIISSPLVQLKKNA